MSKPKRRVRRLALAMASSLPGFMMPDPRFAEADDPWEGDHDSAFGGRRADGTPIMSTQPGVTLGEARVRHYLEERTRSRALYLRLAAEVLSTSDALKRQHLEPRAECEARLNEGRPTSGRLACVYVHPDDL